MTNRNLENSHQLLQLVEAMEKDLMEEPVILETEEILFQELEKISHAVEELSHIAEQTDDFTRLVVSKNVVVLREKIRSLYGKIHNLAVDGEFHLLKVEALLLGRSLVKGNERNATGELDEMQSHLSSLKHNFRSSMRNQMVQDTAERFLEVVPQLKKCQNSCEATVSLLEEKLHTLSKEDLFDDDSLRAIATLLEEADERSPGLRRAFIESEIQALFGYNPEMVEALLSMNL